MMCPHPNFPPNLDIKPNQLAGDSFDFDEESQAEAIRQYGIAGRVWEAAYALQTYISGSADLEFDPPFWQEGEVESGQLVLLELGSGTGIITSIIAEYLSGTRCMLFATDLPDVCSLLEKNLTKHIRLSADTVEEAPLVFVRPLAWGNEQHALEISKELSSHPPPCGDLTHSCCLTHIICSDLVYFPELLAPLLRSLIHVTSPPLASPSYAHGSDHVPRVVISYKIRSLPKETAFWSAFGLWFSFEPVLVRSRSRARTDVQSVRQREEEIRALHEDSELQSDQWTRFGSTGEDDTFVFVARRRPESFLWLVPPSDKELLDGVGAQGTSDGKGDDTFEQLLLMQLGM